MATIKEMALEHYSPTKDEKSDCLRTLERAAFRFGANAVLEIFKEIIENRNFCAFPKAVHQELLDKIKELKGK